MFIKSLYYPLGVVAVLGLIMPIIGPVNAATAATPLVTQEVVAAAPYTKQEVINLINEARSAEGLNPLTFNAKLDEAAQRKADDMVARGYFSHDTPDGQKFWSAIKASGYNYRLAGENLAVHHRSVDTLISSWLNSPTHRYNIMTADFTDTGIAFAYGERNGYMGWFVVQTFGQEFQPSVL